VEATRERPSRLEVLRDLEPHVDSLTRALRSVEGSWQASEHLPSPGSPEFHDAVRELQAEAAGLSDEMLVVLVGNVVTEEGLPLYLLAIDRLGSTLRDSSGSDSPPWTRWARAWTAEEKRHGDVTRGYVWLSGRVDMRSLEDTVQHLLRDGFDARAGHDPYRGLAYATYQEHATKRCWQQLGSVVGGAGATRLHRICGAVAADEARHERAYGSLLREVVRRDPAGALEALHGVLASGLVMPAHAMTDGSDRNLFRHFAEVGHRLGVYTLFDYAENLAQLLEGLGLAALTGLGGEARERCDALLELPARWRRVAEERADLSVRPVSFRWIHGRRA
jgi:acyl-[acyl-carrier-protein] desaturase